jgi:cobalt/nickel transport system permease protein
MPQGKSERRHMHMANELLSWQVAAGTMAVAAVGVAAVCRRAAKTLANDKLPLMGIMGAFVFAAQMVNFPTLPGTSGHLVGAVLLALVLGPSAAALVMTSIVIVQCLLFQDGGLLALGCNVINMCLVPTYVGFYVFQLFARDGIGRFKMYAGSIVACVFAVECGAVCVPVETGLSGVLKIPFVTFLGTMAGVHLFTGLVEGVTTAMVLAYLREVRPQVVAGGLSGANRMSFRAMCVTLLVASLVLAGGLSLIASSNPDGLEWSYKERPNQPGFAPVVANDSSIVASADRLQAEYTPLPDYSVRAEETSASSDRVAPAGPQAGWTSFAGVVGAIVTMLIVWAVAKLLHGRRVTVQRC